jgi:hypothetical protein
VAAGKFVAAITGVLKYVNALISVTLATGVVTTTLCAPTDPDGVVTVSKSPVPFTERPLPAIPPNVTFVVP